MPKRARSIAIAIACAVLAIGACRSDKTIAGSVMDFDTHQPIAGAIVAIDQSGWGWSNGSLVWDKSYQTTTAVDATGAFVAHYTVGSSARLHASASGYNVFEQWYEPGNRASIRLKRLADNALPLRLAEIGADDDGLAVGWNFAQQQKTSDPAIADVLPAGSLADVTKALTLAAPAGGGLHFVSTRDLGVEDDPMIYTDTAPADGYATTLTLDFSGPAGVIFVRTRDSRHYAKMLFTPNGLGSEIGHRGGKTLLVNYVYNPSGGRDLPFNRAQ